MRRRTCRHPFPFPFRFPLDTLVTWAAEPTQTYRVERRRWVETHTGTYAEYGLTAVEKGVNIVCWVNEADLVEDDRVR